MDFVLQAVADLFERPGFLQLFLGVVALLFAPQFARSMLVPEREYHFQLVVTRLVGAFFVILGALRLVGVVHS